MKSCAIPLAQYYDCVLLDLDGVVYVGNEPVIGAPEVLVRARQSGARLAFVTNNASRTPDAVAAHLTRLGVPAAADDVVTSAQAAAREVADRVPAGALVLVIGATGLVQAVRAVGLQPVSSAEVHPAAVVQGFGRQVGWRELTEGAVAIRNGAIWVASNTDLTVPTARGLAPGNGSFVNALAAAVGARPAVVAGKPHPPLFDETIRRTGSRSPLVVGDRLDTDIEGANNCTIDSLLVMTGVTAVADLLQAPAARRPSYVAWGLDGLLTAPAAPAPTGAGDWRLGGWVAAVVDGDLRVVMARPDPDRGNGLRVAAAAAWDWADANSGAELRLDDVLAAFAPLD